MSAVEKRSIFAMFAIPIAMIAFVLWADKSPSCEDLGGTKRLVRFIPVITFVNNVPIVNSVPVLECVGQDGKVIQ